MAEALSAKTRVVYLESPRQPQHAPGGHRCGISFGHAQGAKVVVDNTYCTPTCSSHCCWVPM